MAKDPAFLFYTKDFYEGVATMSFEDRGKYISLLCLMHQQGRLDEETIRFIVGSVSVKLKSKFQVDENGLWYNERLEIESAKRNEFIESRVKNGKLGGRPKASAKPLGLPSGKPLGKPKHNLPVNANEDVIVLDTKESAWKDLTGDELLIEDAKITISQKGWKAFTDNDVMGIMRTFIAKLEMPVDRDNFRRHWRNWLLREPIDRLTEYGKNHKRKEPSTEIR